MNKLLKLDLQLFAEDGSAGGAAAAAPAAAPADAGNAPQAAQSAGNEAQTGVNAQPQREGRRQNIFPRVQKVDVQPVAPRQENVRQYPAAQQAQQQTQTQAQPEKRPWDEVKKLYKDEYHADFQTALKDRFKNQEDQSNKLNSAMQTLAAIAPFYGIDAADPGSIDLEKLGNAIQNDRRWYEESALEKGIPVETEMHIRQLEQQQKRQEAENRRSLEQEQIRQHLEGLRQQEIQMRQEFPNFNLMEEIQSNPAFARMTAPGGGYTVRQAYVACHYDELMQRQTRATEENTKQTMSRAIQAGSVRPAENGTNATGGGVPQRDFSRMSREEWAELRARARRGEKIAIG